MNRTDKRKLLNLKYRVVNPKQLKIIELRHKAEKELGSKFDIKKFHEKVLESGVMPLAVFEK